METRPLEPKKRQKSAFSWACELLRSSETFFHNSTAEADFLFPTENSNQIRLMKLGWLSPKWEFSCRNPFSRAVKLSSEIYFVKWFSVLHPIILIKYGGLAQENPLVEKFLIASKPGKLGFCRILRNFPILTSASDF